MRVNLRLARVRSDSFKFTRHHTSGMMTAGSGSGPQEHGLIEQDPERIVVGNQVGSGD